MRPWPLVTWKCTIEQEKIPCIKEAASDAEARQQTQCAQVLGHVYRTLLLAALIKDET